MCIGICSKSIARYVSTSFKGNGVSFWQENCSQRSGCKKLHVSHISFNHCQIIHFVYFLLVYRIDVNFVIKVSDFGLSESLNITKDYYRQTESGIKLPVKWIAPESFQDGLFSEKSDVVRSICFLIINYHVLLMNTLLITIFGIVFVT